MDGVNLQDLSKAQMQLADDIADQQKHGREVDAAIDELFAALDRLKESCEGGLFDLTTLGRLHDTDAEVDRHQTILGRLEDGKLWPAIGRMRAEWLSTRRFVMGCAEEVGR